jgi:predicted transcriptional regulator
MIVSEKQSQKDIFKKQEEIRIKLIQAMMDYRLSVRGIAPELHVSYSTLYFFIAGKSLSLETFIKILNGLDRLKEQHGK